MPVIRAAAYVRVSSREQEAEGVSLPDQKQRLAAEVERRGWQLAAIVPDVETGKTHRRRRPKFDALLDELDAGAYDALIVTRLDRIARSLSHFAQVLDRSHRNGWLLVMLDPNVDTTTPYGRAMAQMGGVFAELEGALISQRTAEGLAYARARGTFRPGDHCRYDDRATIRRMVAWRQRQGLSGSEIAERLATEGVAPPNGDVWHPRTINRIIRRELHAA